MPARLAISLTIISAALAPAADPPPPAEAARAAAAVREVVGHRGSCADRPENTLASFRRAIEAGVQAAEVDARTTKDGFLVCSHDADLSRMTDGKGKVSDLTLAEIKRLDAGAKFDPRYAGERVPELREVLELCRGKIDLLIDLKETGDKYVRRVADTVKQHGELKRTVLGVRSVEQAKQFREFLPAARQLGLVPTVADIEPFGKAGVRTVHLWPKWLTDETLVPRVRSLGQELHLGAGTGTPDEVRPLLAHRPESLASDDPARLIRTLKEIAGKK